METSELLSKAISKVKYKHTPQSLNTSTQAFVQEEPHKSLFDMLEVWDKERTESDYNEKTKFIYDALLTSGNPKDQLISIFSTLGATPPHEKKVDRVYRYLKLKNEAHKVMEHYETLQREMNAFRSY